jgi:kynureninase
MTAIDRLTESFARGLDREDPLASYRDLFHIPPGPNGAECIYLTGNSLGLQPKATRAYVEQELDDWAKFGVEGHFHARNPWMPYHETLTEMTARLVGAEPHEVVVMNTLTVNLHLMLTSFYRPSGVRTKLLMEKSPFPSDRYAFESHVRLHGLDPREAILELEPREGEVTLRDEDILATIEREGAQIALIILGNPNYLTGQVFDIPAITKAGHGKGCKVGFDLAHGAGNLLLELHAWGPDFAVWCNYKYLNAGPGGLAGCFVHERHAHDRSLPRLAGWWGHDKDTRFQMGPEFVPIAGAEGWQLSNPPILQLAALRASMEIFDRATMKALRAKSERLTAYLEELIRAIPGDPVEILTPSATHERGCQLSLRVRGDAKACQARLVEAGVIVDFREPDVIRAAPTPLYSRFIDVHRFAQILRHHANA